MKPDNAPKKKLIVVIHGLGGSSRKLEKIKAVLSKDGDTVLTPDLYHHRVFSAATMPEIADKVIGHIEKEWAPGRFESIRLVGHSTGTVIAREVWVTAVEKDKEWVGDVERLVFLAGILRGWRITHHLGFKHAILWTLGYWLACVLKLFGHRVTSMDTRQGSAYLCGLRLRWLALARKNNLPLVVQLLGTVDDYVSPRDNIDFATGSGFRYLEVNETGHVDILRVGGEGRIETHRRERIQLAVFGSIKQIGQKSIDPWELRADTDADIEYRESITDVVFVIHGIRDNGYWTDKIARRIVNFGRKAGRKVERVTASYGYFGMGPFLFPWVRRQKVEWLAERYVEARAMFNRSDVRFHFVGHSNGTYLLASALKQYPSLQFDHVVFAGSVVRRDYSWLKLLNTKRERVKKVLNVVATHDWVVGIFPHFFELLRWQDLGSAGHNGFDEHSTDKQRIATVRYARGDHSAGIREHWWDDIANFVIDGTVPEVKDDGLKAKPARSGLVEIFVSGLAHASPLVGGLLVAFFALVLPWSLFSAVSGSFTSSASLLSLFALALLALLMAIALVWLVGILPGRYLSRWAQRSALARKIQMLGWWLVVLLVVGAAVLYCLHAWPIEGNVAAALAGATVILYGNVMFWVLRRL